MSKYKKRTGTTKLVNQASQEEITAALGKSPAASAKELTRTLGKYCSPDALNRAVTLLPANIMKLRVQERKEARESSTLAQRLAQVIQENPGISARELKEKAGVSFGMRTLSRAKSIALGAFTRPAIPSSAPIKHSTRPLSIFQALYSKRTPFSHDQLATISEIVAALNSFAGTNLEVCYITHPLPTLEIRNNQSK